MSVKPALIAAAVFSCFGASLAQTPERERPRDEDGDGFISRAEFEASRKAAFERLDADGDGQVTFAEFNAPALQRFETLDKDGDGRLSREEMKEGRPGRGRFGQGRG